MPSMPFSVTVSGSSGLSRVWQPDYMNLHAPFNVTIASVMNSTSGTGTYTIDLSNDDPTTLTSTAMTWFSSISLSTSGFTQITAPCRGMRISVSANTSNGTVKATFVQAG